jgi:hypothetical protein
MNNNIREKKNLASKKFAPNKVVLAKCSPNKRGGATLRLGGAGGAKDSSANR